MKDPYITSAARTLGGAKSDRKAAAARENGRKGGRPRIVEAPDGWKLDGRRCVKFRLHPCGGIQALVETDEGLHWWGLSRSAEAEVRPLFDA